MEGLTGSPADQRAKQTAVEVFLGSLVKGAKTVGLYKPGHPTIAQVADRVNGLLAAALGQEPNLPLEVKAKSVLFNEAPLAENEETISFASNLHLLGIGQVLLSPRVTTEGMTEFMRLLMAKPAEGQTLTDLQKAVQSTRIDGIQIIFILSFVVTGEQDEAKQKPGQLREEQVLAFIAARTVPDFLHLLYKQNEPLTSKEAEDVASLLDETLNRETPLEDFEARMPWSLYDPRIRERWDRLAGEIRDRSKWPRDPLVSSLASISRADAKALEDRHIHEAKEAGRFALERLRAIVEDPAGDKQAKYAVHAYARLLSDLARAGNLDGLFAEFGWTRGMEAAGKWGPHAADLNSLLQQKLPSQPLAAKVAERAPNLAPDGEPFRKVAEFIFWTGEGMVPLLLDELRQLADRNARKNFSALLAAVCRPLGAKHLLAALADEDYFLVVQIMGVLVDMGYPDTVKAVAPLLSSPQPKVREGAVRTLQKCGGPDAVAALSAFIRSPHPEEERKLAVTSLSLINEPGVDERLVEAFEALEDYDTRVAIATALGRLPSARSRALLERVAAFNWLEWLTGRNKALRAAARHALAEIAKEMKA